MADYFCADESRNIGEDIGGTAGNTSIFALIECPTPWPGNAFNSPHIPASLKRAFEDIGRARLSVRPLLIQGEARPGAPRTKVLVYRRKPGLSDGYAGQEIDVESLDHVAAIAKGYLAGSVDGHGTKAARDILVCTHGTHDKCCAKYGVPFYEEALATVAELGLSSVRVWQCSHIGGHRFAPTVIDLPDGRYYGALDRASLVSILTRTGDIRCLRKVYRGLAGLPSPVQLLEKELILRHGWEWFGYKVAATLVEQSGDRRRSRVEITFQRPDGSSGRYTADIVVDEKRSLYLTGDCNGNTLLPAPARLTQFAVSEVQFHPAAVS